MMQIVKNPLKYLPQIILFGNMKEWGNIVENINFPVWSKPFLSSLQGLNFKTNNDKSIIQMYKT